MKDMKKRTSLLVALLACVLAPAVAKVELPSVIGSHMVLQRNADVNLWGKATPGKKVTIKASWSKEKFIARVDADGKWATTIPTTDAGGPYTLTFDDGEKTELTDILLGEVWVCGGQSNMEMPVGGFMYQPVDGAAEHIREAAQYPGIRMFTVPRCISETPKEDCDTVWRESSPLTVRTFSAAAYFFGKELHRMLGVPVGLITSNWGGTVIEAWMSREALDAIPGRNAEVEKTRSGANASTVLYNGMIKPICNFTAKGFIWYQGCSNRGNWYDYAELQKAHIRQWRKDWGNESMPFYFTQIAPYCYEGHKLRGTAVLVDQQWKAADETEHCDIVCTTDIGNYSYIHAPAKDKVGQRLAHLALTYDYGIEGLPVRTPRFKSFEKKENKLVLSFSNMSAPNNFTVSDPTQQDCFDARERAKGFEVAGPDRKFYPAQANHMWCKNQIEVWSDSVANPVAVRYAYQNYSPDANVRTMLGLPLPSFRSDDWPLDDIGIR